MVSVVLTLRFGLALVARFVGLLALFDLVTTLLLCKKFS